MIDRDKQLGYRQVFKAMSILGGVQIFSILIGIIRSKFIAILLGTTGIGMLGLYQSMTALIQGLTSMGVSQSAVRSVAEANGSNDVLRMSKTVYALRRIVGYTGALGMIVMIVFSPLLSSYTFGDDSHTFFIICLSVTLLLQQVTAGQNVILQGTRRIKSLAKAGIVSSLLGLVLVIPMYYIWGVDGIVPGLILISVISLIVTWNFSRKVHVEKIRLDKKELIFLGGSMMKLGIAMSLGSILATGVSYLIRSYISLKGGLEDVGLYSAGFMIINSYVGLVFAAMSTDYYPRLAAVNSDNNKCREIVNQQAEVAVLVISPLLLIFLVFMSFIMTLLYSTNFLQANEFMRFAVIGMLFRVASWAIAYQLVAKGDGKVFVGVEFCGNLFTLLLSIIGYRYSGLSGLGLAFTTSCMMYLILVYYVAHCRYKFTFLRSFVTIYVYNVLLVIACLIGVMLLGENKMYFWGVFMILIVSYLSLKGLNKRLGLIELLRMKQRKK